MIRGSDKKFSLARVSQKYPELVEMDRGKIEADINLDLGLLAEAYQINLRAVGEGKAYNELKELTRGKKLVKKDIDNWINNLKVDNKIKEKLSKITPSSYIGYADINTQEMISKIKRIASVLL